MNILCFILCMYTIIMLIVLAVKCPVPKSIPIGSVTTTGLTYGSLAIYSCPKNYLVDGYQKRQCQSDGTWTGTPPKCVLQSESKWYSVLYA